MLDFLGKTSYNFFMDPKLPIRSSTQEQVPLENIRDNLFILKDGNCGVILSISALNFSLLSETEQEATIYAYAALLNSLTFPIQILTRSKQKDISSYLAILLEEENKQKNPLLQGQIKKYRKFVEEMIKRNNVLDKDFYVVIPFSLYELGAPQIIGKGLFSPKKSLPFSENYIVEKAKINLGPKKDQLIRQFNRIGLVARQLNTQELTALFYEIYNPKQAERQKISADNQYSSPVVQSAPPSNPAKNQ